MNNPTLSRLLTGAGIIGIGVLALLDTVNFLDFSALWQTWWPLILIYAGIVTYIANSKDQWWSVLLVLTGAAFLFNNLSSFDFNLFSLFWPLVIIAVGVSILRQGRKTSTSADNSNDQFGMMSVNETRNTNKDYTGGKTTAIMGGVTLDLRGAHIKKIATLDLFILMGGVEITVPKGWIVDVQTTTILGGTESKADTETTAGAPTLVITGTVALGGVEIKY